LLIITCYVFDDSSRGLTLKVRKEVIGGMKLYSLALDVVSLTRKTIKTGLRVFERRENLLQNGILHSVNRQINSKLEFTQTSPFRLR